MDKQSAYREGLVDGRSGQDHRNEPAYFGVEAEYLRGLGDGILSKIICPDDETWQAE